MYGTSENSVLLSVDIILDGFHGESFGWLPKSRGLLVETIIGENLEQWKQRHSTVVRLEQRGIEDSLRNGTYNFDFTS
jgi:hypothetical protein